MNPQKLLEQFLGRDVIGSPGGQQPANARETSGQAVSQGHSGAGIGELISGALGHLGGQQSRGAGGFGVPGGALGGLAAGGLLGVLLGNKKVRKMAGGVVGYGGAAVLGALALRAYQNWRAGQQPDQAPVATAADAPQDGSPFAPANGADGRPFALALIRSMIAAANADGHIGPEEQKQIFEAAGRGGLDAEDKAFVFDALQNPSSPDQIAALAGSQEQAAELYLAARIAIDPDHPDEQAFLRNLAQSLKLPAALVSHLDAQVAQNLET
ncbi:MAG: protein YebE [Rhodospirillaceae bacterium]|nr:protein YebE [Rhodospirillaceae bacterium]